jgi:hypothetical protein
VHGSRRLRIILSTFLLFAIQTIFLYAEVPSLGQFTAKGFPDNTDLRGRLFSNVIGAPRDVALNYGERQLQSAGAGPVTVRVEKRSADFVVEFINQNAFAPDNPGRGSCFIQRSSAKGNYILQARILLEDDPSCFLALYPSGSGTRGDIVMYGAVVKKGLFFSDMLYRVLLLSFSDMVDATKRSFDWGLVFRFEGKGNDTVAELRASSTLEHAATDQASAAIASSSGAGQASSPFVPYMSGKYALAAAPANPAQVADALPKGPRSARLVSAVDRAASVEALALELGDMDAREISPSADSLAGYLDSCDSISKLAYAEFPRYDSRGLSLSALRAALYADLMANPDSSYAVMGDGLRAVIVPCFDESGRLGFACFSGGKEMGWADLSAGKRDLKVRALRVPAGS